MNTTDRAIAERFPLDPAGRFERSLRDAKAAGGEAGIRNAVLGAFKAAGMRPPLPQSAPVHLPDSAIVGHTSLRSIVAFMIQGGTTGVWDPFARSQMLEAATQLEGALRSDSPAAIEQVCASIHNLGKSSGLPAGLVFERALQDWSQALVAAALLMVRGTVKRT